MTSAHLIDGQNIAQQIRHEIQHTVSSLQGRKPCLAFLLIGEDPASKIYVEMKKKRCSEVGILSVDAALSKEVLEQEVYSLIAKWNQDPTIDGILVQLPLPSHLSTEKILNSIDPSKDVDGFHPINLGKLLLGSSEGFKPCTPLGIQMLLEKSNVETSGKHVVIIGRGLSVGKPLAALLMQKAKGANATVTVAHSQTEHLSEICKTADILIVAIGKPHFLTASMVKPGAVIIDVGSNKLPHSSQIVGDVDFDQVLPVCSKITPVPGGVGPMTIAMLLSNTLMSYRNRC